MTSQSESLCLIVVCIEIHKLHICEKVYFSDQLLSFSNIAFIIPSHFINLLCNILLFGCWIFSMPSGCQTVWIQIRPDNLSGLIWVQTVCKGYQQSTLEKSALVNTKQLVDTTFWLKPWLKLISLGSNFFHLAKVLATTNLSKSKP